MIRFLRRCSLVLACVLKSCHAHVITSIHTYTRYHFPDKLASECGRHSCCSCMWLNARGRSAWYAFFPLPSAHSHLPARVFHVASICGSPCHSEAMCQRHERSTRCWPSGMAGEAKWRGNRRRAMYQMMGNSLVKGTARRGAGTRGGGGSGIGQWRW